MAAAAKVEIFTGTPAATLTALSTYLGTHTVTDVKLKAFGANKITVIASGTDAAGGQSAILVSDTEANIQTAVGTFLIGKASVISDIVNLGSTAGVTRGIVVCIGA